MVLASLRIYADNAQEGYLLFGEEFVLVFVLAFELFTQSNRHTSKVNQRKTPLNIFAML